MKNNITKNGNIFLKYIYKFEYYLDLQIRIEKNMQYNQINQSKKREVDHLLSFDSLKVKDSSR